MTDQDGHAVGHGCARPEPKAHRKRAGPGPPGQTGFTFSPASRDGPPGGYGTWRLRTPGRRAGPDHHPGVPGHRPLRPPAPSQRPRPRGQAEAPDPGPARHLHQPGVPAARRPVRRRAQHPVRRRRTDLPLQHRPEVPPRPPAQAAPQVEGRPAPRRHLPLDHTGRAAATRPNPRGTPSSRRRDSQQRMVALRFPASRLWGGAVMSGPGDQTPAAEGLAAGGRDHGDLRASHADRERVIGTVKAAFVQGRLTEDELDARVGQVYASRTYAELAAVTADHRRHPRRAHRSPVAARPVAGDEDSLADRIRDIPAGYCRGPSSARWSPHLRGNRGHLDHGRLSHFLDSRRIPDDRLTAREAPRQATTAAVGTGHRRVTVCQGREVR